MRKTALFLIISLYSLISFCQELQPADLLPDISLPAALNGKSAISLSSMKGKVVIIDFWATWCSPCIKAMKDLETLKAEMNGRLEVFAISDETEQRLKAFNKARPSTLTLISDTSGSLLRYFPHQVIPHTILIGPEGKVYAITNVENLTLEILQKAANSVAVSLPLKKDPIGFDINTYFKADSTIGQYFSLQAVAPTASTMSKTYPDGPYRNRRLTIVNMPLEGLFRLAYDKTYHLVVNEYDTVKRRYADMEKFCLDAWVSEPDKEKLMHYIQEQLKAHFVEVDARLENRKQTVLVIKARKEAGNLLKPSNAAADGYDGGGGHFEGNGVKLDALADYMEGFGIFPGKVINETGLTGRYDIFFQWQPERKESLTEALSALGLYCEKAERKVEMLILRKKD